MANQTISGLNSITTPATSALLWVSDATASPQDRSFSLQNLWAWIMAKLASITSAISTTSTLHASGAATFGSTVNATGALVASNTFRAVGASTLTGAVIASNTLRSIGVLTADAGVVAGAGNAALLAKVLTGTTSGAAADNISHGLTKSKIRGVAIAGGTEVGFGGPGPTSHVLSDTQVQIVWSAAVPAGHTYQLVVFYVL